jgi:hypothetical protein
MPSIQTAQTVSTPPPPRLLRTPTSQPVVPGVPQAECDEQFLELLGGFRRSGGVNCAHDVGHWLEDGTRHQPGTLSRWMAHDEVIHFEWQTRHWLPMFQFDFTAKAPRVAIGLVLIEWGGAFDPWRMARWFASAHPALEGRNPAEVLCADPGLVIDLARHDGPCASPQPCARPALGLR